MTFNQLVADRRARDQFNEFASAYRARVRRQLRRESMMDVIMIAVAAALMLALMTIAAHAGVTCTQAGNSVVCYDSDTGKGTICTHAGNSVVCN